MFAEIHQTELQERFTAKIGIEGGDWSMVESLLAAMADGEADFTLVFRHLSDALETGNDDDVTPLFNEPTAIAAWPGKSTVLTWDNDQGLTFEREVELSDGYLFTVTQRVTNNGEQSVTLSPYGLISRTNTPDVTGFYVLHEGPIGVFDGTLNEYDYDDLQDSGTIKHATTGGWLGITDIYWLVALAPDNQQRVSTRFVHDGRNGIDKYQADMLYEAVTVAPGDSFEITSRVFAGAKEVLMLADYRDRYGIKDFEKAVDFGIFWGPDSNGTGR